MVNTRPKASVESVTIRLTAGERAALDELVRVRVRDMAKRGEVPDATITGLVRSLIRQAALKAGVAIEDGPPAKAKATSKAKRPGR